MLTTSPSTTVVMEGISRIHHGIIILVLWTTWQLFIMAQKEPNQACGSMQTTRLHRTCGTRTIKLIIINGTSQTTKLIITHSTSRTIKLKITYSTTRTTKTQNNPRYSTYNQTQNNPQYNTYNQTQNNPRYSTYNQTQNNPQYNTYNQTQNNPRYSTYNQTQNNPQYNKYNQTENYPWYFTYNQTSYDTAARSINPASDVNLPATDKGTGHQGTEMAENDHPEQPGKGHGDVTPVDPSKANESEPTGLFGVNWGRFFTDFFSNRRYVRDDPRIIRS